MLLLLLACLPSSACTDYCDYICDCHAGEEGFDCEECHTAYAAADAQLQDECETSLADLRQQDEENGHVCGTGGTDTGAG